MNIFFDHQTFSLQSYGGISRYYAELISGINSTINDHAYLPLVFSNNTHLSECGIPIRDLFPGKAFYKKSQLIYKVNQAYTIAQLKNKKFDIFHATYYDSYFVPYLKRKPFVITFLDMIHERFATQFSGLPGNDLVTKQKQLIANHADRIIAISESTKRDIVEILNVDPAKIDVIYLGSSLKLLERDNKRLSIDSPYLLFVGRRERYKNFEGLLSAIYPLLKKYNLKLLCAGGGEFTQKERLLIHSYGVDALVEQCPIINDSTLQDLYSQATAFLFPTMYEGFGIPVLEAFACNCPCIVSNLSSLPEVAGDAALYIDPSRPESIGYAIEQILHNSNLRQILIEKGRQQLSHFSWQKTVNETLSLYNSLV
ncbi:glycosyltransferase family 4 protein [Spirosoma pulveris]